MVIGHHDLSSAVVKRATFSSAAAADIVAAVTGKRIRVTSVVCSNSAAGNIAFKSASTDIGTLVAKTADPTIVLPWNPDGWFQTVVSEKFAMTPTGGTATGFITYIEV